MILLNGREVEQKHFPDGTALLKYDGRYFDENEIIWCYETDAELFTIMCIAGKIDDNGGIARLCMPYIPHARMDRVKNENEFFTLKYFAEAINSCNFDSVSVLDPHSYVSEALIDRVHFINVSGYIMDVINCIYGAGCQNGLLLFYPDEGSMKRYSGMITEQYVFGIKKRDWKTGNILGLDIAGNTDDINGKDILIVDDICSRGGTFYHSAKKLKELGAGNIYLYVTHCENTILEGEMLTSGLIERVYTTDSIFTKEHEKISVIKLFGGR